MSHKETLSSMDTEKSPKQSQKSYKRTYGVIYEDSKVT